VRTRTTPFGMGLAYLNGMFDLFRPLLSFRKYWIAHKILKILHEFGGTLLSEGGQPAYKKVYGWFVVKNFKERGIKSEPSIIMMVVDMLVENGEIDKKHELDPTGHYDILKVQVRCNKKGEEKYIEGFYIKKVYLFWIAIIGAPAGLIGIIELLKEIL
jgi:hypothetical protein